MKTPQSSQKSFFKLFLVSAFILLLNTSCSCEPRSRKQSNENSNTSTEHIPKQKTTQSQQQDNVTANIYLENSGSMFGYVSGGGNFINVVSTIAGDCDLECSQVNYSLINASTTPLGKDLTSFTNSLTLAGMNRGKPATSDLNKMFETVLEKANNGSISILISDGIYSLNNQTSGSLITKLQSSSLITRNTFVKRLRDEGLTTYLIKYSSTFTGKFFPANGGTKIINQDRPFFVWVIGTEKNIEEVFSENYFAKQPGYQEIAKFVLLNNNSVPSQLCIHNQIGSYRFRDPKVLQLTDVEPGRDRETAFSMAFDFSKIPVATEYFFSTDVYGNDLNYKVTDITTPEKINPTAKAGLQNNYTHIVTFKKIGYPCGTMKLNIMNNIPDWIEKTSMDNDDNIEGNTTQTFGFKYLIEGIANAYKKVNNRDNITEFEINIRQ